MSFTRIMHFNCEHIVIMHRWHGHLLTFVQIYDSNSFKLFFFARICPLSVWLYRFVFVLVLVLVLIKQQRYGDVLMHLSLKLKKFVFFFDECVIFLLNVSFFLVFNRSAVELFHDFWCVCVCVISFFFNFLFFVKIFYDLWIM